MQLYKVTYQDLIFGSLSQTAMIGINEEEVRQLFPYPIRDFKILDIKKLCLG